MRRKAQYDYIERNTIKDFSAGPNCSVFELNFCQIQDLWGIFWQNDRHFLLVDPMALSSSLLRSESIVKLNYCFEKNKEPLYVKVRREETYIEWIFQQEDHSIRSLYFSLEEYADKIKKAIKTLYRHKDLIHCRNTPYACGDYFWDLIRVCIRQLSVKGLYLHHRMPYTNEIPIEVLSFDTRRKFNGKKSAYIGFGKRGYHIPISKFDYSGVRHQLESFVFTQNATIDLGRSDERYDMILRIEEKCVLNSACRYGAPDNHEFPFKTYVLVSIEQKYVDGELPILQAYCDEEQALEALHEGFLLFALRYKIEHKEGDNRNSRLRLPLYNILKSPMIERFLAGFCDNLHIPDEEFSRMRQPNIRTILRIEPDCGEFIWFQSEERLPVSAVDDCFETLLDQNGEPITIEGFSAWQNEIASIWNDLSDERIRDFDWEGFHERGLDLADALRAQLPDDVDLWYSAPLFDPSGIVPQPFLIGKY